MLDTADHQKWASATIQKYVSSLKVHIKESAFVEMGTSGSRFTILVEFGRFWTEVLPVWCLYGPREGPTSSLPSCMSVLSIASNQVSLFREAVKMPLWAKGVLKQNYLRYYFKRCSCLCHHCIGVGLVFVFFSAKLFLGNVLSRMVWRA